jgi:ER-bound oxygenase mpaB/B'/Rubber oxygenase, catalytic domain
MNHPWRSAVIDQIKRLDPEKDHWEIVRLSSFYDFPWDYARSLEIALFKSFASPSISAVLHHSGKFERQTQKRYDDTDIIINSIIEYGLQDDRGKAALNRLNFIHSHFNITNDDYLYVLSTFILEPRRWIDRYGWRALHDHELRAGFRVWKEIGEAMGISHIPASAEALEKWSMNYEETRFSFASSNHAVSTPTLGLLLGWFSPPFMHRFLRPFALSLFDVRFLNALGFKAPNAIARISAYSAFQARKWILRILPKRRSPFRRTQRPFKSYPQGHTIKPPQ